MPGLNSVFSLSSLPGIDRSAVVTVSGGPLALWLASFGSTQPETVTVYQPSGPQHYNTVATSLSFYDINFPTIYNKAGQNELLGNFLITEPCSSIPLLPAGSYIPIAYSIQGQSQGNLNFTVVGVPEPSSLVVVGLVGFSVSGFALLRRRRRVRKASA